MIIPATIPIRQYKLNHSAAPLPRLPRPDDHGLASPGAAAAALPRPQLGADGLLAAGAAAHRPEDLGKSWKTWGFHGENHV